MVIDHHKGECEKTKKLDNRLSNLRLLNYKQNSFNITNKNPNGYRGVTKVSKDKKKWIAKLNFEGKTINSKVVDTIEEAALEWNNMVLRTWGENYGIEFVLHNLNRIKNLKTELIFID